jgi:hypothetical protein
MLPSIVSRRYNAAQVGGLFKYERATQSQKLLEVEGLRDSMRGENIRRHCRKHKEKPRNERRSWRGWKGPNKRENIEGKNGRSKERNLSIVEVAGAS